MPKNTLKCLFYDNVSIKNMQNQETQMNLLVGEEIYCFTSLLLQVRSRKLNDILKMKCEKNQVCARPPPPTKNLERPCTRYYGTISRCGGWGVVAGF